CFSVDAYAAYLYIYFHRVSIVHDFVIHSASMSPFKHEPHVVSALKLVVLTLAQVTLYFLHFSLMKQIYQ
ncbi:MAG: hypothetical protein ACKPKO_06575, partial [Candidatus Fonsibacter sp.]